jgi:hypothetical protein
MPAFTGWLPHSDRTFQDVTQLMVTDISIPMGPRAFPMAITSERN